MSNIFEYFQTFLYNFQTFHINFQTFSNVFERFLHKLARLMRKSALLIDKNPAQLNIFQAGLSQINYHNTDGTHMGAAAVPFRPVPSLASI